MLTYFVAKFFVGFKVLHKDFSKPQNLQKIPKAFEN